jgi:hypothetical protein
VNPHLSRTEESGKSQNLYISVLRSRGDVAISRVIKIDVSLNLSRLDDAKGPEVGTTQPLSVHPSWQ